MKNCYLYILTNKTRSVLYIGVTSDLITRIYHHKQGKGSGFTAKYKAYYLIYFEEHHSMDYAIQREKQMKKWKRDWKLELIKEVNSNLEDLWDRVITR